MFSFQITVRVRLEYLGESEARQICSDYGLSMGRSKTKNDDDDEGDKEEEEVDKMDPESNVYEVFNKRTFGLTEKDIVLDVHGCVQELLQKDRESERRRKRLAAAEGRAKKKGRKGATGRSDDKEEEE